jgi:hypothetical protein
MRSVENLLATWLGAHTLARRLCEAARRRQARVTASARLGRYFDDRTRRRVGAQTRRHPELETPACVQKDVDGEGGPVPCAPRHLQRHRRTRAARAARMACGGCSGYVHSCSLGNCKFRPVRSRPSQTRALPPEREHCAWHTGASGSAHQVECATLEHCLRRVVMPDWVCAHHYNAQRARVGIPEPSSAVHRRMSTRSARRGS